MARTIDVTRPRRVLMVASNAATSPVTGWPIGFWWSELTHPYWEFTEHGYAVDIASPDGGDLVGDGYSDPSDPSGYSADDLLSLGFLHSPAHMKLLSGTPALADVDLDAYDAVMFLGGQGPMVTFPGHATVDATAAAVVEAGKVLAVICHGTCLLLEARLSTGEPIVAGRTWTGFADSEEDFADEFAGQPIQPFRIEERARAMAGTNFIVDSRFKAHAVRDGNLVTGQQQYSGVAAARLVIEALGV